MDDARQVGVMAPTGNQDSGSPWLHPNGFTLFLPGVDPKDHEAIRQAVPEGSPLHVALRSGGVVVIGKMLVPVPHTSLSTLQVQGAVRCRKNVVTVGTTVRLPDHLASLHATWDALKRGVPGYDLERALRDYLRSLDRQHTKVFENRVMRDLLDGIQAQASTDIRLPRNTVGMSRRTAELFHQKLGQVCEDVASRASIEGLLILVQRFPTANTRSARWTKIVVLTGVPDFQLLFNPEDWNFLNGGDTDGDLGYGCYDGVVRFGKPLDLGDYPRLVRHIEHEPKGLLERLVKEYGPVTPDKAVERVMSMSIKELTGPMDYTFHCLARSYAVEQSRKETVPSRRHRQFREAYLTVFGIYFPVQEAVMDARKMEGGNQALRRVAGELQEAISGKALDSLAFAPFLEGKGLLAPFQRVLGAIGHGLSRCRQTAFGFLVAAGRKREERLDILLEKLQVSDEEVLETLQQDAQGEALHFLPGKAKRARAEAERFQPKVEAEVKTVVVNPKVLGDNLLGLFRSIHWEGQPVFSQVSFEAGMYNPHGSNRIALKMSPHWQHQRVGYRVHWSLVVEFPQVTPVGDQGHAVVAFSGNRDPRFFRPRFILEGGVVKKVGLGSTFKEAIRQAVTRQARRRDSKGFKAQWTLEMGLRSCVEGRSRSLGRNPDDLDLGGMLPSDPLLNLIHQDEFEVVSRGKTVLEQWEEREQILTHLASTEGGSMDVLSTSKGKPGTVVSRANAFGVPNFLHAINPFAVYLDGKRRVEAREIRRALPLAHPEPLAVTAMGTQLPPALAECITHLNCAVLDCNANTFPVTKWDAASRSRVPTGEFFRHDTLVATAEGVAKLAVARLELQALDLGGLARMQERLADLGYPEGSYRVEEEAFVLGEGLTVKSYRLILDGPIEDVGKVKATVGPIKGVLTVIPVRLEARHLLPNGRIRRTPIHLLLPQDTLERKKALDAVLYMLAAKAGIESIDPAQDLRELVEEIRAGLQDHQEDPDGLESVVAIHPDGTVDHLGQALVGVLPFYRPPQTGLSTFAVRRGEQGIPVHAHALVMSGLRYCLPERTSEAFLDIRWLQHQIRRLIPLAGAAVTKGTDAGTPSLEDVPEGACLVTEDPEGAFESLTDAGFGGDDGLPPEGEANWDPDY